MAEAEDFDRYFTQELQDNYRAVCAEQFGGDWAAFAEEMRRRGEERWARWGAAQGRAQTGGTVRGRRAPAKEQATR